MAQTSPSPEQQVASIVTVEPWEPYPTGSPPDPLLVLDTHVPQALTDAEHWQAQSEANLAAGGIIPGAEAYEPPAPPEGSPQSKKRRQL